MTRLIGSLLLLVSPVALAASPPPPAQVTSLCGGWSPWIPRWANTGFTGEYRVFEESVKVPGEAEPACVARKLDWRVSGVSPDGIGRAITFIWQAVGAAPGSKSETRDQRQTVRCIAGGKAENGCTGREFLLNGGKGYRLTGPVAFTVGADPTSVEPFEEACLGSKHAVACYELARLNLHSEKGDRARGVVFAQAACEGGAGDGCWLLGACFEGGLCGMKQDDARAQTFFEQGCTAGGSHACKNLLSVMVRRNESDEKLRPVIENACKAGGDHQCGALGLMLENGVGGKKDPAAAAELFQRACLSGTDHLCLIRACKLGQVDACNRLLRCTASSCDDVSSAQAPTRRYVFAPMAKISCDAGSDDGCVWQAIAQREGWGMARDYAKSFAVFEALCTKGNALACSALGEALTPGSVYAGVANVGADKAAMAFKRACVLGERTGCYENGNRVANLVEDGVRVVTTQRRNCERGDEAACEAQKKVPPRKAPMGERRTKQTLVGAIAVEPGVMEVRNQNEFPWTNCEFRVPPNRVFRMPAGARVPNDDDFIFPHTSLVQDLRPSDPYIKTGAWALAVCAEGAGYLAYDRQ